MSPAICNAIARKMDHRLMGVARRYDYVYSRYADDLAFSGDDPDSIGPIIGLTRRIAQDEGFRLNDKKTRVLHAGQRQVVTGVVVNEVLGLSRQERRRLRAAIHQLTQTPDADAARRVAGKLAYLHMLNPAQADALRNG